MVASAPSAGCVPQPEWKKCHSSLLSRCDICTEVGQSTSRSWALMPTARSCCCMTSAALYMGVRSRLVSRTIGSLR